MPSLYLSITAFRVHLSPLRVNVIHISFRCDFQGFYSVLGSVAGMLSGTLIAVYTYLVANRGSSNDHYSVESKLPSKQATAILALSIFAFAVIVAMLPIIAFDHYINNDEGFCYINWYDGAQSSIMFVITLPTFVSTICVFSLILRKGQWPDRLGIWLMLMSFISAWVLWLPASIFGFTQTSFPRGYQIAGGILGHAQVFLAKLLFCL